MARDVQRAPACAVRDVEAAVVAHQFLDHLEGAAPAGDVQGGGAVLVVGVGGGTVRDVLAHLQRIRTTRCEH